MSIYVLETLITHGTVIKQLKKQSLLFQTQTIHMQVSDKFQMYGAHFQG